MERGALIWDLDGTLLDSYEIIVSSLQEVLRENGIPGDKGEILRYVIRFSVMDFLRKAAEETGCSVSRLSDRCHALSAAGNDRICPMPHAREILAQTAAMGVPSFVFTHKGRSAFEILEHTGLLPFFTEVVTGADGFPRKPSPDAVNYLVEKYGLDRETTYYVGDRQLDMECAANAGIRGILYLPQGSPAGVTGREDHVVKDLLEIGEILK